MGCCPVLFRRCGDESEWSVWARMRRGAARDHASSMNVESGMATMRGSSMTDVSSRVMSSPNGARLIGSSTNDLMPCVSRTGSMLRRYLTCTGICWSPALSTKSRSGSLGGVGTRSVFRFRMTESSGADDALDDVVGLAGEFWACVQRVGREGNPFL